MQTVTKYFGWMKKDPVRPSPAGSKYKDDFTLVFDENHEKQLKFVGVVNQYEMIQSFAEGVELSRMIARYKKGDQTALDVKRGFYADVSSLPSDYKRICDLYRSPDLATAVASFNNFAKEKAAEKAPVESEVKADE